jgi:hypothetical protein
VSCRKGWGKGRARPRPEGVYCAPAGIRDYAGGLFNSRKFLGRRSLGEFLRATTIVRGRRSVADCRPLRIRDSISVISITSRMLNSAPDVPKTNAVRPIGSQQQEVVVPHLERTPISHVNGERAVGEPLADRRPTPGKSSGHLSKRKINAILLPPRLVVQPPRPTTQPFSAWPSGSYESHPTRRRQSRQATRCCARQSSDNSEGVTIRTTPLGDLSSSSSDTRSGRTVPSCCRLCS